MAGHQLIEDRIDSEDFLFGDAQQVVVIGPTLNDAPCGTVEIGRLVDDDRRITRSGDDWPVCHC